MSTEVIIFWAYVGVISMGDYFLVNMYLCVCVRERESETEKERDRER
jgi:hypothetical protein